MYIKVFVLAAKHPQSVNRNYSTSPLFSTDLLFKIYQPNWDPVLEHEKQQGRNDKTTEVKKL